MHMDKFICVFMNKTYLQFNSIVVNNNVANKLIRKHNLISLDLLKYRIALYLIYHDHIAFEMENKNFRLFNTYSIGKGFFQINWSNLKSLHTLQIGLVAQNKIPSTCFSVWFYNSLAIRQINLIAQTVILVYACTLKMLL